MIREANWTDYYETRKPEWEQQFDTNARPGSEEAGWRHRPRAYTGDVIAPWRPGPAPEGSKEVVK